jgi:hypothetical protein
MRVLESEAGSESNLAATECWNVETMRSNPALFVQVTVRLIGGKLWGVGSEEEVGFLEFFVVGCLKSYWNWSNLVEVGGFKGEILWGIGEGMKFAVEV